MFLCFSHISYPCFLPLYGFLFSLSLVMSSIPPQRPSGIFVNFIFIDMNYSWKYRRWSGVFYSFLAQDFSKQTCERVEAWEHVLSLGPHITQLFLFQIGLKFLTSLCLKCHWWFFVTKQTIKKPPEDHGYDFSAIWRSSEIYSIVYIYILLYIIMHPCALHIHRLYPCVWIYMRSKAWKTVLIKKFVHMVYCQ